MNDSQYVFKDSLFLCKGGAWENRSGTLTDARDKKTYRTVQIGAQTWMAENLNYIYRIWYCYGNLSTNCDKYGQLYSWTLAMDASGIFSDDGKGCGYDTICSPTYPVRGVCPEGWHLPDTTEWNTLIDHVESHQGGTHYSATYLLRSVTGWDSYHTGDMFGFGLLPSGYYDGSEYSESTWETGFWTSTESNKLNAHYQYMGASKTSTPFRVSKKYEFPVRCVKD